MKPILLLFVCLLSLSVKSQIITTFAGTGVMSYAGSGGPATNAGLIRPVGLGFDNYGNLLVCSQGYLSRINYSTNVIEKIGGDSVTSFGDGGPATNALINDPRSICSDRYGNLFVADYWARSIRKIEFGSQIINSYAGILSSPGYSGDGGPATNAKLNGVFSICIDTSSDVLYLADTYNYRVRKVDMLTGIISTVVGVGVNGYLGDGGLAIDAKISRVTGLCLDKDRNLYIGDWDNARIRKVDITTGLISTFAGSGISGFSGDGGVALSAQLSQASGMVFDTCGNFYFSDCGISGGNYRIRKIEAESGVISTIAGTGVNGYLGDGGLAIDAKLSRTNEIRLDVYGNLYISDIDNNRVRKITPNISSCYSNDQVKTDGLLIDKNIKLYPNPTNNEITVEGSGVTKVALCNVLGQVVYEIAYKKADKVMVDISHHPPGIYMVRVNDVWVGKVVKE